MPVSVRHPGLQAQGSRCRTQAVQEGAVSRTAGLLPLTLHPHLCLEAAFAQGPAGMQRQSGFQSQCSLSPPELLRVTCPHPGDKRVIHEVCRQHLTVSIVTYLFQPELGKVCSHFSSSNSIGEAGGPGVVRSMHVHGATLLGQSPGWLCGLGPWAPSLPFPQCDTGPVSLHLSWLLQTLNAER